MAYTEYLDTLRAYWPGGQENVQCVIELSLAEAYRGGQRQVEPDGIPTPVTIPAGVHTGAKLYYPDLGRKNSHDANYCEVIVHDHPPFKRSGDNLHLEWKIDAFTAILGGDVTVPTLFGQTTLHVPAGTAPGTTLHLAGEGMPVQGQPRAHGDLCVHLEVTVPEHATELERKLIEDSAWLRGWRLNAH